MEGYPTESNQYFKKANVNDLVLYTIGPILTDFILKTGRNSIQLLREKEEFVIMDLISVKESNYVLIIEAKKASLGDAMKQCLLSMKDARDNNGGGRCTVSLQLESPGKCSSMMVHHFRYHVSLTLYLLVWTKRKSYG